MFPIEDESGRHFSSSSSLLRTGVRTTAEIPGTIRSTTEAVGTNVTSKTTDVRDLLIVSDENENDPLVDPTEVVTTNLVIETAEVKEERDIDPSRDSLHEGGTEKTDDPLRPPLAGSRGMNIIWSNARISKGVIFVKEDTLSGSARIDSLQG